MGRHSFVCPVCGKGFRDDIQLGVHKTIHGHWRKK